MKKAFIFDLDGTLTNSIYDIGDSVNHILVLRGLPTHTYEEYKTYMGMGIGVTLRKAMPGYDELGEAEQAALRNEYTVHNAEHCLDKTRPYEGITGALAELQKRGVLLGVFTNKPEVLGQKIAGALFKDVFAFIMGGLEGAPMKPDPGRVLAELKKASISPEAAVFVGDGAPDIATAKNGGFFACGVSWGFKGREELDGADRIINHPDELLEID
ncbi:MAG: HAD family hydrolase [Treponema sp.]|nr:HAD family hydrolase [Treponema sp.]